MLRRGGFSLGAFKFYARNNRDELLPPLADIAYVAWDANSVPVELAMRQKGFCKIAPSAIGEAGSEGPAPCTPCVSNNDCDNGRCSVHVKCMVVRDQANLAKSREVECGDVEFPECGQIDFERPLPGDVERHFPDDPVPGQSRRLPRTAMPRY